MTAPGRTPRVEAPEGCPSGRFPVLPALSGLLLALAFPPLDLMVPAFVALAPLAVRIDRSGAGGGRRAFRAGSVTGAVAWALLLAWIPVALLRWSWMAVLLYGAAVLALAALTGGVAWAAHGLRHRAGLPLALALPLAWTAGEWLRAHLPGPLAFPWLELATSLAGRPEWIGIAEWVGGRGVGFWLAAVSGLVAAAWRTWETERGTADRREPTPRPRAAPLVLLGGAALLAVAVAAVGVVRAGTLEPRVVATVAVVQPGVTRRSHPDPDALRSAVWSALDRLAARVAGSGAELVVLPEAVLPDTLGTPAGRAAVDELSAWARRVGAPLLVGALVRSDGARGPVVHNSVVAIDGEGLREGRWDKHHLVPVVERLPLLPLPGAGEGFAGYAPGEGHEPIRIGAGWAVGAFVCYESAFSRISRGLAREGADLLVNVTNDGWFGRAGLRTHALRQHPAHLAVRAVETRTGIARAASTGYSFFVDPLGRVEGRTPLFREALAVAPVSAVPGRTGYVLVGDLAGAGSTVLTVLLLALGAVRSGRHIQGARG